MNNLIRTTIFIISLLCFPFSSFTQVGKEIIKSIEKTKGINYNFSLAKNTKEIYSKYELEIDGTKKEINGELQVLFFKNAKKGKTLNSKDKQTIASTIKPILLKEGFQIISTSEDFSMTIFRKKEENTNTNYIEFYIPDTSKEFCELIYIQEYDEIVFLDDRSFEEYRKSEMSRVWVDCAPTKFKGNSPPGVFYDDVYNYGFAHPASDGKCYLSLIAREDETWEIIAQELNYGLKKDSCYKFGLDLRQEDQFKSFTKLNRTEEQFYDTELKLKIGLSKIQCYPEQTIYESVAINHLEWQKYELEFKSNGDYNFIIFEANYIDDNIGNGNIMLDNIQNIERVTCKN